MALAERLYAETDGELQSIVVSCINAFSSALSSNSNIRISKTREKVAMHLLQINILLNSSIFDTIKDMKYESFDESDDFNNES